MKYDILSENIKEMQAVACYHRRQRKKGSARKARYWERARLVGVLRLAKHFADKGLSYIV